MSIKVKGKKYFRCGQERRPRGESQMISILLILHVAALLTPAACTSRGAGEMT